MIVLSYLRSQCTTFYPVGWRCWSLTSLYQESCVWPDDISDPTAEQRQNFVQISGKVRRRPWQWLDKRSGKEAWVVHQSHRDRKWRDNWTAKSSACSSLFFDINWIVHKGLVLEGQTVNPAHYSDFYGDCVNMCEDFSPNFGDKRTGSCIKTTHISRVMVASRSKVSLEGDYFEGDGGQ
jgi:hypothetical protein